MSEKTGDKAAMRKALVEIDELTNLLDIPEDKKNLLLSPSHSYVAVKMRRIIKKALQKQPRNCDKYTADELKAIFKSELVSELPIANEHEKNLVTITAMCVIDTLFATFAGRRETDA